MLIYLKSLNMEHFFFFFNLYIQLSLYDLEIFFLQLYQYIWIILKFFIYCNI